MAKKKQVDIKAILADPDLRRKLMVSTIQATQAREGIVTTKEQAERAYYVVTEAEKSSFFDLDRFKPGKKEPDRRNEMFINAINNEANNVRFDVARRAFLEINGSPLSYRRVALVSHIFKECPSLVEPSWGEARQGLATGDDPRFVRNWWEIPAEMTGVGKPWISFAKGGDYSRFYSDVYLLVQLTSSSIEIMNDVGRYQNVDYYFKPGLTWPRRTAKGLNVRILPENSIFADKGPGIFFEEPIEVSRNFVLGISNTHMFEFLFQTKTTFSWEVGIMKAMPIPDIKDKGHIANIAESIFEAKSTWDTGNEISTQFEKPWILREDISEEGSDIPNRLNRLADFEAAEEARIQKLYAELNDEAYRLYGIPDKKRSEIEEIMGPRPPELIWPQMEGKSAEQKRMEHVWRQLSYIVKLVVEEDEDGIVPFMAVSGETALIDRMNDKLAELFPGYDITRLETDIVNELKKQVKGYKSVESIRQWMEEVYFDYHTSLYKKRPIIWHIASRQGRGEVAFGALAHYHKFDRDRFAKLRGSYLRDAIELFRREAAMAAKENREEDRLDWQSKLEEAQELDRKLEAVQEGRNEGKEGGEKDYRILTPWKSPNERPQGWDPDINDGVKVNIEPLQKAGVLRIAKVI